LVGGVVVIVHPDTLSFDQYVDALSKLAIGVGILWRRPGAGRGAAPPVNCWSIKLGPFAVAVCVSWRPWQKCRRGTKLTTRVLERA
jgi:hypothetical protein